MKLKADRQTVTLSAIAILIVACAVMWTFYSSANKRHSGLLSERTEMMTLRQHYLALKGNFDAVAGRKTLTNVHGIAQAVDDVFKPLGLSDKVTSVKSAGVTEKEYGSEEQAEVQVEKVSMNEMANIFYKIENAPMILTIKTAKVKTSFDNPQLLNISMTLTLVKPK